MQVRAGGFQIERRRGGVLRGGVLAVVATGAVTPASFRAGLDSLRVLVMGHRRTVVRALLVDMRKSFVPASLLDTESLGEFRPPSILLQLPGALITSAQLLGEVRRYGMMCATAGALVGGFTGFGDGYRWVVRRSRALLAQQEYQKKGLAGQWRRPSAAPVGPRSCPEPEPDPLP